MLRRRYQRRDAVVTRNYTTPAILTMLLYLLLWVPGFIANIVYIRQSRRDEGLLGYEVAGSGCLYSLLIVFAIVPGALFVFLLVLGTLAERFWH